MQNICSTMAVNIIHVVVIKVIYYTPFFTLLMFHVLDFMSNQRVRSLFLYSKVMNQDILCPESLTD